jgi:predicted sulfurtransferase
MTNSVAVTDFAGLINLEKLSLSYNQLEKLEPATFQDLWHLKVLDLSNNCLTQIGPDDFVGLVLRNDFEIQAGYFEKTVNPKLQYFRDLPSKIKELSHLKNKKIVAVCTGDIRVEKATAYLKREGFTNVYQLKDGIFSYMKKYPGKRFKGTLFTFDNRMVTPVVEGGQREVVGRCAYCKNPCEEYYNDDSIRPSRKVICCATCYAKRKNRLRPAVPV